MMKILPSLKRTLLLTALFHSLSFSFAQQDFKPNGKVWGYAFGDFYYKTGGLKEAGQDSFFVDHGDTTIKAKRWGDAEFAQVPKDYYAFTLRRIYLGYDYNITPALSTRILLEGSDGVLTNRGDRTTFIKAIYLEWKNFLPKQTIRIGQSSTPSWSTFTETRWAYRAVEKTLPDMHRMGRSNDVGISIQGEIADFKTAVSDTAPTAKSLLHISYNAMAGNGAASKPENNYGKVVYGELIFRILNQFLLEAYYEYEYADQMYIGGAKSGKRYKTSTSIYRGFLGYDSELFAAGIEAVQQVRQNTKFASLDSATDIHKDTSNMIQQGLSFWTRGAIIKDKLFAFARYDFFNSDGKRRGWEYYNNDSDLRRYDERFMVFGIDWRPLINVQVMPNLWINSYKDMSSNLKDYRAVGPNAYKLKQVKREADIVPRITLFFRF